MDTYCRASDYTVGWFWWRTWFCAPFNVLCVLQGNTSVDVLVWVRLEAHSGWSSWSRLQIPDYRLESTFGSCSRYCPSDWNERNCLFGHNSRPYLLFTARRKNKDAFHHCILKTVIKTSSNICFHKNLSESINTVSAMTSDFSRQIIGHSRCIFNLECHPIVIALWICTSAFGDLPHCFVMFLNTIL